MKSEAPAVATCPACRNPVPVRCAPSGTVRIARHNCPEPHGRSCRGTGLEIHR